MERKDITHPGDFAQYTKIFPSPGRGCHEVTGEGKTERTHQTTLGIKLKKLFAFSLIELMISLITISLITAAFAPVISKKLSSSEFTIGVGSGSGTSFADLTSDCSHINDDCAWCNQGSSDCVVCDAKCDEYRDNKKCVCETCSSKYDHCSTKCSKTKCEQCEIGYYLKNDICTPCNEGSICNNGITEEQCPEGKYCLGGNNIQDCPNGKWSEGGAKSESDCISCEQGYSCKDGIKTECSAGYYSKSGATTCTNCDSYNSTNSAYYNTSSKSNTCTLCEAGNMCVNGSKTQCDNPTFATQGSTYCSECTNCTECDNKTGNCTKCKEGYYINPQTNKCTPCETGYYCPGGNDSTRHECPSSCSSCTSQTNCTGCRATYQLDNNGSCNPCPEGYYCSGGVASAEGCVNSCKSCSNTSTCNTCNNGYYINNSSTCTQCEEGYICTNGKTRSGCSAGSYTSEKGQTTCSTCDKGYYCIGSKNQQKCPSGTYRSTTGATKESDCTSCSAGTASNEEGRTTACPNCKEGEYASGTKNTSCSACPEGKGSTQGSSSCNLTCATGCKSCTTSGGCSGGCSEGYDSQNGACVKAPEWYYFSQGGYYIAKRNVGDEGGPLGSSAELVAAGISVLNVTSYNHNAVSIPVCWQGTSTSGNCTTYGAYSGCNRTVCNWFGANKACKTIGYSLPTPSQLTGISSHWDAIAGPYNGAHLCGQHVRANVDTCSWNCGTNYCVNAHGGSKHLYCCGPGLYYADTLNSTFGSNEAYFGFKATHIYGGSQFHTEDGISSSYGLSARCVK